MNGNAIRAVHRSGVACARPLRPLVPAAALARPPQPDGHPHRAAGPQPLRPRPAGRRRRPLPPPAAPGGPFGRNQPLWAMPSHSPDELLHPEPPRDQRAPAGAHQRVPVRANFLNLLAASWLQFMVHDWLSHGTGMPGERDPDPARPGRPLGRPHRRRRDARAAHAAERGAGAPGRPGLRQHRDPLVGRIAALREHARRAQARLREGAGGRLRIGPDGLLPLDEHARHRPHRRQRQLVARPRRSCTRSSPASTTRSATMLAPPHPDWDDERLFEAARRVTAAVMAKIHTVEWTPALVPHPTVRARDARQLVRPARPRASGGAAARDALRRADRHPRLALRRPRRALLAHRGVRRRLPHAPAAARRVRAPRRRRLGRRCGDARR